MQQLLKVTKTVWWAATQLDRAFENRTLTFVSLLWRNNLCTYLYEGSRTTQTKAVWDFPKGQEQNSGDARYHKASLWGSNILNSQSTVFEVQDTPTIISSKIPCQGQHFKVLHYILLYMILFRGFFLFYFNNFSVQYYSRLNQAHNRKFCQFSSVRAEQRLSTGHFILAKVPLVIQLQHSFISELMEITHGIGLLCWYKLLTNYCQPWQQASLPNWSFRHFQRSDGVLCPCRAMPGWS